MQDNSIKRDDYDQADGGPTFEPTATPSKPNQADPNGCYVPTYASSLPPLPLLYRYQTK